MKGVLNMATVQKRGENSYRLTCYHEGKRYRKTITARSKTEAKKRAAAFEAKVSLSNEKDYSQMILVKFAQKWLDKKRSDLAANTLTSYKRNLNLHILPRFGRDKISEIVPMDFVEFYDFLKKEKDLSSKSINIIHGVINIMFNDAVKWDLIKENPLKKVDPPKIRQKKDNYYNVEEINKLFSKLDEEAVDTKYRVVVYVAALCGLRAGEILGLEWKDIDFSEKIITIRRTSIYVDKKVITKEPKNQSSIRKVYFGEALERELLDHKKHQEELSRVIPEWKGCDRVLTRNNGQPMFPLTPTKWFTKFIRRHYLKKITLHGLRHTSATLMISNGTDVRTVAERLGHSDANTTMRVYSHHLKKANKQAALDIENFINKS